MFSNIPDEMKQYNQFVCWCFEETQGGKPTKVPYCPHEAGPSVSRLASVKDPFTWGSFQSAVDVAHLYSGIGFVLSENDPYTFIDLDDPYEMNQDGSPKYSNPQEILDRQLNVFNKFDSFSEKSPSGKGLHIIVKAAVASGRKRSAIEVYSSLRYMTMTGNVYKKAPVVERQELTNILWEQLGKGAAIYNYEGDTAQIYTDLQILEMGMNAANTVGTGPAIPAGCPPPAPPLPQHPPRAAPGPIPNAPPPARPPPAGHPAHPPRPDIMPALSSAPSRRLGLVLYQYSGIFVPHNPHRCHRAIAPAKDAPSASLAVIARTASRPILPRNCPDRRPEARTLTTLFVSNPSCVNLLLYKRNGQSPRLSAKIIHNMLTGYSQPRRIPFVPLVRYVLYLPSLPLKNLPPPPACGKI